MPARIALIEDDDLIRSMIQLQLQRNGFDVQAFSSAEDAPIAFEDVFDLIILDILLPGQTGEQYLKALRKKGDDTPVLMLTVKNDIHTRIHTLDTGADDYMSKPFNFEELLARVKALIRRSQARRRTPSIGFITINRFRLDISTRKCTSNLGDQVLSEKEVILLKFMVENANETFYRADILEEVWGMDVAPTPRTVDNFILKFRRLFEDSPEKPKHFLTVRGHGYRYEP
ncbi:MAG: response regulator transcription factor [Candidatus Aminicenantes bacterium]|nr:response regulator transcription factor [Acidobacteriota bacterium]MCG2816431.1 response regulator transcription factor [Candidatus Aminicenantes bacterium]